MPKDDVAKKWISRSLHNGETKELVDIFDELEEVELTSGEAIRMNRNHYNLTLDQLAKITHISSTDLSALENDKRSLSKERAVILATALRCSPSSLMFPNGRIELTPEIKQVAARAKKFFATR